MRNFSIVVAMDEERGIGKNGTLAWHLPADLKHFKQITSTVKDPSKYNAVIMGRKTWESLPEKFRPLPGRLNVVLTRGKVQLPRGVLSFADLDSALNVLKADNTIEQVFVIGGAQLFDLAITHKACTQVFLTELRGKFGCDTFFPVLPKDFAPTSQSSWMIEEGLSYHFLDYFKKALS